MWLTRLCKHTGMLLTRWFANGYVTYQTVCKHTGMNMRYLVVSRRGAFPSIREDNPIQVGQVRVVWLLQLHCSFHRLCR